MCTHLTRRGATYYFRRVIPDDVRPAFGNKAEWVHSLRTKDRDEGKRLAQAEAVRTNALIDEARALLANADPTVRASVRTAAHPLALSEGALEALRLAARDAASDEQGRYRRKRRRREMENLLQQGTAQLSEDQRVVRDMIRDERFEAELARDRVRVAEARLAELAGSRTEVPPTPLPTIAPAPAPARTVPTLTLNTIIDKWANERNVRPKTKKAHQSAARMFIAAIGEKPLAELSKPDVRAFKDKLIEGGQSAVNTNNILQRLRTLLNYAAENDFVAEGVANGVRVKVSDADRNIRLPLSLDALTAIFGGSVYSQGARPKQGRGEAAYWMPLLGLYTGARREEIGQLRMSDIMQVRYPDADDAMQEAWFIRITTDDDEDLTLKNRGSIRMVPVHPIIERLGFIPYVERLKANGEARLFPELMPTTDGALTEKWGQWFSRYLRGECGVTDKQMVFHSFRHTFADYARHAGIEEGIKRQIMGHSSGDVADTYGSGFSHYRVVEAMRQYRVPGFTPPARSTSKP